MPATDSAAATGILDLPPEPSLPTRPLERTLRLFSDVREGEGPRLLALTLNVFLILVAYYVMKPVREVLILAQPGGAELKSYAYAAQAALFIVLVPLYGAVAAETAETPADQRRDGAVHRLPAGFLPAGRARRGRRAGVLPVDRRVQPDGDRAVLGLRQRRVYAGRGQAAVRGDRLRRVVGRGGGRVAVGSVDPHHRRARAAAGCRRGAGAEPDTVQFHRPARQSAAPGRPRGR